MKLTAEVRLKLQRFGETPRVLTGGRGGCRIFFRAGGGGGGAGALSGLSSQIEFTTSSRKIPGHKPSRFALKGHTRKIPRQRKDRKNPFFGSETRKIPDHKTS